MLRLKFNLAGIAYIGNKLFQAAMHHAPCTMRPRLIPPHHIAATRLTAGRRRGLSHA